MNRGKILQVLSNAREIDTRWRSMLSMTEKSRGAILSLPPQYLQGLLAARQKTQENLATLLEKTVDSARRRGCQVFVAETAEEALRYIVELAKRRGVKRVIKSKSMTTEELDLNHALSSAGIEVVETDLGERIVQLAGQRPSHIIAPAVHLSREDVARLVKERRNIAVDPSPEAITRFFRKDLWQSFQEADMGITGANIVVAEDGHVVIVTNEGNGRLVTTMPRILVSVAGIEKIVESWEDAFHVLRVLPASAVGRDATSYITVIGPRAMSRHGQVPEYHLVLVNNGRLRAGSEVWLKEALRCIRCAACLDICPTFRVLGGHIFGDIYTGPMGVLWTAITRDVKAASEIAKYCVSCSLCLSACPVQIDIPLAISRIKDASGNQTTRERMLTMYERYAALGSSFPRLFNWLQGSRITRRLLESILGIDRRRMMHRFKGGNLYKALGERYLEAQEADVVYFPDTYATFMDWGIGLLAVRVLEANGYSVAVPKTAGSGMPSIQYGFHSKARQIAEKNVRMLKSFVEKGSKIVCTEPTAAYCLSEAYPKILGSEDSKKVAEATTELVALLATEGKPAQRPMSHSANSAIFYHHPCHSRLLAKGRPSEELLKRLGYSVSTIDYGCCGIAGTWGMRVGVEGYLISSEIGRRVADLILATGAKEIATESSVCAQQLRQFTGLKVRHTIRYIAEYLGIQDRDSDALNF
ncbi:MAG: LUD domain-containing protein [Nitrososphaerota archaeon]